MRFTQLIVREKSGVNSGFDQRQVEVPSGCGSPTRFESIEVNDLHSFAFSRDLVVLRLDPLPSSGPKPDMGHRFEVSLP